MPYHTTRRGFGFYHICSQRPTPVLSASAYFNKFAVLVRTYSVRIVSSVSFARFPVFFPRTQTGYERVFLFFSLSQFYGCRNPRAPVFVVWSLFLFARAETQRRITDCVNKKIGAYLKGNNYLLKYSLKNQSGEKNNTYLLMYNLETNRELTMLARSGNGPIIFTVGGGKLERNL